MAEDSERQYADYPRSDRPKRDWIGPLRRAWALTSYVPPSRQTSLHPNIYGNRR
ncbi:hypothetical protein ABN034_33800 [Actinopolymorpha sp. B11F2]|uniref:hypothetical protein n=1 Tax=Actinopolymorpha sp. B11F2 TaxID=3160862 RepID=UPI0032E50526